MTRVATNNKCALRDANKRHVEDQLCVVLAGLEYQDILDNRQAAVEAELCFYLQRRNLDGRNPSFKIF